MKAFKFRFKTVLKVVTIKEREAQRAFFSAKKRMEETIDLKNQLEKEQEATEKFIIKGKNFTSMIAYQEALIIEINLSNVLIANRNKECELKKGNFFEKRTRRKMIEKIKEKDYARFIKNQLSEYAE